MMMHGLKSQVSNRKIHLVIVAHALIALLAVHIHILAR